MISWSLIGRMDVGRPEEVEDDKEEEEEEEGR